MSPRTRRVLHAALVAGATVASGFAAAAGMAAIGAARLQPPDEFECLGAPGAAHRAVYLHGIDSFGPSWQELHNRDVLAELAARFDLRLALPRGVCSRGRCWPEPERALPWIQAAARACFDAPQRPHGLIGFSNGGFLVGALARACGGGAGIDWLLVASAGGTVPPGAARDLAGCPPVRVVVGDGDRYHREPARALARDLAALGGDARLIEFAGGHELAAGPVGAALADLVGPAGAARAPWHATHALFAVAGALLIALVFALYRWRARRRLVGARRTAHHLLVAGLVGVEAALGVSPGGALATTAGALAAAALLALAAGAGAALHAREPRSGGIVALAAAASFALAGAAALAAVLWIL